MACAGEIEIGVVAEVHVGWGIGYGVEGQGQFVVFGELIGGGGGDVAGETLIAIGTVEGEREHIASGLWLARGVAKSKPSGPPWRALGPLLAGMWYSVLVGDGKGALGDAIGVAADAGAPK